jgi:hypothetical protein
VAATLDLRELRTAGAVMLGCAFVLPALPGHPGVACPLRAATGIPCPLCGMTTSVEDTVHLHVGRALAANPAGVGAVVAALLLLVLRPRRVAIPTGAGVMLLASMWLFELHRFGFL